MNVLVVDVGGTHVKILATGKKEKREFASGPRLTAPLMVSRVRKLLRTGGTKRYRSDILGLFL
jgi:polyphosphate glucokinase